MFARIIRIIFGSVAGIMLVAAVGDVLLFGHLTIITPVSFGALLAVALAYLLNNLLASRERSEILSLQAAQLKTVAGRLEASLKNAAAINARLNQSEVRYKGLVDAQGDAIFRRDASSRLTYGNDAFFKLFGTSTRARHRLSLRAGAASGKPRGCCSAASGAGTGPQPRPLRPACQAPPTGYRWIAWEDFAVRDSHGRLVEVQSVGRDITDRKVLEDALTEARDSAEAGQPRQVRLPRHHEP